MSHLQNVNLKPGTWNMECGWVPESAHTVIQLNSTLTYDDVLVLALALALARILILIFILIPNSFTSSLLPLAVSPPSSSVLTYYLCWFYQHASDPISNLGTLVKESSRRGGVISRTEVLPQIQLTREPCRFRP